MRCKKHLSDLSSGVGVCASCLREKLFAVILTQAQAQAEARIQQRALQEEGRKSDTNPPVLVFPRSVSPYISRRKSDISAWNQQHQTSRHSLADQRFYSTPQVGPNGAIIAGGEYSKKKKNYSFSLFYNLFRSKSLKPDSCSDPRVSNSDGPRADTTSSSSSSNQSWFSTIFSGRRKKQNRTFSLDEETIGGRRINCHNRDRGMSPARCSDDEEDQHCRGGSSGYSSESSQGWKQTPRRTPAAPSSRRGNGRSSRGRNVSGMTFCLSPLVRASPNQHWNQKGMPPDMAYSGELRAPSSKSHLSSATSFCKNRSRKLADFGSSVHRKRWVLELLRTGKSFKLALRESGIAINETLT
nr:uncharacterized protein LOC109186495 [Ipomoea batatas]